MSKFIRIPLALLTASAAIVVAAAAVFAGGYYYVEPSLPDAEQLRDVRLQVPLRIYSRDGRLIAQFGEQKRTPVPYEAIPTRLTQAVLAAEDDRFFEHPGLDYVSTARAAVNFVITGGERVPGGSTITQQLARDDAFGFLSRDYNLVRKFKELMLALRIEREFTKEEILELFMNTTFFGHSSYGVVAAARTYFDKNLDELSLSDVAIIAGIPQGPSIRNPVSSREGAAARRDYVLRRMHELGMITEAQRRAALEEPIHGRRYGVEREVDAPYVAEMVRAEMIRRFGPAAYTAGLNVTTTVDSRLQSAANRAVRRALIDYDQRHGYRGPLARVELEPPAAAQGADDADDADAAGTDAPDDADASAPAVPADADDATWRALLADYPDFGEFETALVLAADEGSADVFFRGRGRARVGLEAVQWAAPYLNDNAVGSRPDSVDDALSRGDVVRFRELEDGSLRLAQLPQVQGAFVALDPQDGAVSALVGGFDYVLSKYNRATQSLRQPGSAFKPFVYSAALEHGFTAATIVNDAPLALDDPIRETVWRPENYSGRFHGPTRLREALYRSLNLVSIRVVRQIGVFNAVNHARRFGFRDDALPADPTIALGSGSVAPLDLANGYAILANGGYRIAPYFIDRVYTAGGEPLYSASPDVACSRPGLAPDADALQTCRAAAEDARRLAREGRPELAERVTDLYPDVGRAERAVSAQNAYLVTDMMKDVIWQQGGSGARARALGRRDLAGKTGTTNDRRDTWFAGFNGSIVGTAWVGFDDNRSLGRNEQGGVTAIPMWIEFMEQALAGQPENFMARPAGIVDVRINPETGAASSASRNSVFEKFRIQNVPEREAEPAFRGPDVENGAETPGSDDKIF